MSQYDTTTGMTFGGDPSDAGVFAEFYLNPVVNNFLTEKEGRPIHEDKLYVRIRQPGDRRNEVDREAKDDDKRRFPLQWARFQQGETQATSGTPLEEWPLMTPATVKNLKHMGVSSVEQLAAVTDGNLPALGMGARGLRDQAVAYLARANEGAALRKSEAENQKLREEIDALKANMDSLAAAVRAKESREAKGNAASAG